MAQFIQWIKMIKLKKSKIAKESVANQEKKTSRITKNRFRKHAKRFDL